MHRRRNLAHLILSVVIVLALTLVMVVVDAQAQIAFSSNRNGNFEIYVMGVDGGHLQNLSNNPSSDTTPSGSPDGERIAFMSTRDGHVHPIGGYPIYDIYVMDADGSNQQNLTSNPHYDTSPAWSPDGQRIAFASNMFALDGEKARLVFDICVMNADGGDPQRLTNNPHDDRDPSWSPDGQRIVFSARREGHVVHNLDITYEIYVMDADGQNKQRLTDNRNNDWEPSWSPDGQRIAFASDRKGDISNFDIYVMDADGGNQQKLTTHRAWDGSPSWSPDGQRIVFRSKRDGNWEIYVMDADGGNLLNLTNNNRHFDASPAWLNSPFSVSPAGNQFTMWGQLKQVDR